MLSGRNRSWDKIGFLMAFNFETVSKHDFQNKLVVKLLLFNTLNEI